MGPSQSRQGPESSQQPLRQPVRPDAGGTPCAEHHRQQLPLGQRPGAQRGQPLPWSLMHGQVCDPHAGTVGPGCDISSSPVPPHRTRIGQDGHVRSLTMLEARSRAGLLTVDGYELDVDLTGGPDTFRSTTTVRFRATPGADTFIELRPHTLRAARLNGRQLDPATLAEGRLPLPGLAADNELVVEADYPYSRSSEGMHRFVDPADGKVYIYAQPSITQAPRFMACFDQPDLKAPVTLRVTAD